MGQTQTTPANPKASPSGRRALANYTGLGRTAIESQVRMRVDNTPGASYPNLKNFDNSQIVEWAAKWLSATYHTDIESILVPADKRHSFDPYPATGEQGHYKLDSLLAADGSIRIAVAGDWGTGTDEAQTIADNMMLVKPELTIHLGDVYYVGEVSEVAENCLGQDTSLYKGVTWPKGLKGSFALNGNHEMYSGGHGYFEEFLPTLGIPSSQDKQQLRSYFCLETPMWRILAIDTGYNADTLLGNCKLDDNLIKWLQTVIDPVKNRKPTILLSHHQWFSDFGDGDYDTPAGQMAKFLQKQEIVWLWGHEHRLSVYNKYKDDNGISLYARCIGHGGMPVETGDPTESTHQVEYYDGMPQRTRKLVDGTVVGLNGYMQMVIQGSVVTLEYLDINKTSLLKESFEPGGTGAWDGTLVRKLVSDPEILMHVEYEKG
jgi:hypothetical protein